MARGEVFIVILRAVTTENRADRTANFDVRALPKLAEAMIGIASDADNHHALVGADASSIAMSSGVHEE